jgi:hypothetical protein
MTIPKNTSAILKQLLWLPVAVLLGIFVGKAGILALICLVGLVAGVFFIRLLFASPKEGVFAALLLSFFVNGITRYIADVPLGLSIDFILLVTLLVALFSPVAANSRSLNSGIFWVTIVWLLFTMLEIVNPEARSKEAWFYAVRGVSLYQVFAITIVVMYFNQIKDIRRFINASLLVIAISVLWGARQLFIGLDHAENAWLMAGAYKTHLLFGILRVFSFYSDAGQFGATAAYGGLVGIILSLGPFKRKIKLLYLFAGLLGFWGMLLSGTRGALFVPAAGVFGYLVATRKIKIIVIGLIIVGCFYSFLKFTAIGNDNNQIRRLRSALDPNDPSLLVRKENQAKFKIYLASRPIGGGIGTSGSWGIRFTPGTFLATTPNDSWYVKIWAETGIIGLSLHIFMLLFFIVKGYFVIFKLRDPPLKQYVMAIHAGFIGIALAAYGNPILGQFPLNIILYATWGIFIIAPGLDTPKPEKNATAA